MHILSTIVQLLEQLFRKRIILVSQATKCERTLPKMILNESEVTMQIWEERLINLELELCLNYTVEGYSQRRTDAHESCNIRLAGKY